MRDAATVETPSKNSGGFQLVYREEVIRCPAGTSTRQPSPDRTERQFAIQICTLIARASQAAYWVYKLWELN